jgi:hypothetical protein
MSKTVPSGRHSRFPAVNREGASRPAPQPQQTAAPAESQTPNFNDLTVREVLEWVGDDAARAATALAAERAGKNRKSLIDQLES